MAKQTKESQTRDGASSPDASSSRKRKASLDEIEVDLNQPEPPSKKARRALKKGKPLPTATTGTKSRRHGSEDNGADSSDDSDAVGDQKKTKKKTRSPHGVWIGNLPFTVTKGELRKWLVDNSGGAIADDAITRVHLPTNKPDKKAAAAAAAPKKPAAENKGFAYVDFASFEARVAAVALSETELGGRKLLIKDSNNFEGRPQPVNPPAAAKGAVAATNGDAAAAAGTTAAPPASSSSKIFVGNLGFATTEDDLREHFDKCGPIRWVKVATFEDTGKCKGYAWVQFQDAEAAAWAVKGFVKIREPVETLEDFMDEDQEEGNKGGDDGDDEDGSGSEKENGDEEGESAAETNGKKSKKQGKSRPPPPPPTRFKTRKWWVNQLHGRTLKIELAEDDHVRYKKRFGKGGTARTQKQGDQKSKRRSQQGKTGHQEKEKEDSGVATRGATGADAATEGGDKDSLQFHGDINVARLTGAAVKPQGKKVTFD
ncbi:hypothetical protein VTK73DRAFT_338 [Phialemonium thermophilum]|uniref:RRM domain-containing protein n=1 Tax=Phialemonium thermophilum TaxID=223376 RepID=A0ABR3XEP9_9PEZI